MKYFIMILSMLLLTNCGYSSKNNELIGQVKKVVQNTPLLCDDYTDVDISLGVMRQGVGSMSSEDNYLYVEKDSDIAILKKANETGKLVKIIYDVKRFTFCVEGRKLKSVEILE